MRTMDGATLLTAEDLLRGGGRYERGELWDGVFLAREPSGGRAETVSTRVTSRLAAHVDRHGRGWVVSSNQGFLVRRDPDRVLSPDGAYVSKERLPEVPERGFMPLAPDFALEVRSPEDSWLGTIEKAGIWIAHGVRVVWAIDPLAKALVVLRPGERPLELGPGDVADAGPALAGFSLALDDVFRGL